MCARWTSHAMAVAGDSRIGYRGRDVGGPVGLGCQRSRRVTVGRTPERFSADASPTPAPSRDAASEPGPLARSFRAAPEAGNAGELVEALAGCPRWGSVSPCHRLAEGVSVEVSGWTHAAVRCHGDGVAEQAIRASGGCRRALGPSATAPARATLRGDRRSQREPSRTRTVRPHASMPHPGGSSIAEACGVTRASARRCIS